MDNPTMTRLHLLMLAAFAISIAPAHGAAQREVDIADLDLEQLTRITVTTASRRSERLVDAPASIFVINAEDIRRSGATSIAEALRIAPNLHVARTDASQYSVSARGGTTETTNKMLVLIDGRAIYTPLFSGVFWDSQDILLENVERIEVISGPAATLWGANGVNGVINIISLPAARTQGFLLSGGGGTAEGGVGARYGAALGGSGHFRAHVKYFERDRHDAALGGELRDKAERAHAGFRADWGDITLIANGYRGDVETAAGMREISGSNVVARWSGSPGPGSDFRLQFYYDRSEREHAGSFRQALDTYDFEYQQTATVAAHRLVWGAGYRHARDRVTNSASLAFLPADKTLEWSNAFIQDEIGLGRDLRATLGLKFERNPYTGVEALPNLRLAWTPAPDHLVWGAVSRAVRAPSRLDRDLYAPGSPPFIVLMGNDTFESEIANVAEAGYRAQLSAAGSFSITAFHHDFPNLRSLSPPGRTLANNIEGRTSGVEWWGSYRLSPGWRLSGGATLMSHRRQVKPGQVDLGGLASLGNDPKRTAQLRSSWDLGARHEIDVAVRHASALPNPALPAYTVVDARLGWRFSPALELALEVQNLLDHKYSEFGLAANRALLERSVFLRVRWRP